MTAKAPSDLGFVDALVQLSFAVQAILGAIGDRNDVSIPQMRLVGILRDREPGMLELARALNLEKSSATGLVDRAEKRGLVERTAARDDGRAVHVRITAKGAAIATEVAGEVEAELLTLAHTLSPRDRQQLARLAGALVG